MAINWKEHKKIQEEIQEVWIEIEELANKKVIETNIKDRDFFKTIGVKDIENQKAIPKKKEVHSNYRKEVFLI